MDPRTIAFTFWLACLCMAWLLLATILHETPRPEPCLTNVTPCLLEPSGDLVACCAL